jgi:hypothetical protein
MMPKRFSSVSNNKQSQLPRLSRTGDNTNYVEIADG